MLRNLFKLFIITLLTSATAAAADYVPKDYVWTTQSRNSSESMPCGGHDIGMNVWVENGDILFYLSKSGMFDENNTLLKAGRFRLHLTTNPFTEDNGFSQTLCLDDGAIYIKGGKTEVRIWADVYTSAVYAELISPVKTDATLSYENWRYKDRPVTKAECQQGSYKWLIPKDCMTFKDSVRAEGNTVSFLHKNREQTVYDFTIEREQLNAIKDKISNPIGGLCFGGAMQATGFRFAGTSDGQYASTDYRAWNFKAEGIRKSTITISLFCGNDTKDAPSAAVSRKRSARWWHAYWQRSHITAEGKAAKIARNYELFRYMLGCNAYGEWPTKFNGGLFTFDPVYVDPKTPFTPDYRRWGGGTMTAQNQRLVYWPMLRSGDTDMMLSQFDTYLRMLPAAVARTRHYWGHGGASFTEQIENFGLPNPAEYGKHKPGDDFGTERNAWLEYLWDTSLEFCSMILYANQYTSMDIRKYEPLIGECLAFFDEHYKYLAKKRGVKSLDGNGKLVLYPSSGCETYKMAYNPSSTVAALKAVIAQCKDYAKRKTDVNYSVTEAGATAWTTDSLARFAEDMEKRIPDIPLHTIGGDTCIAPALAWERIQNEETPQLYPVFPWRIYGIGRPDIGIAINTYMKDPQSIAMRSAKGWKQDNIWAACLGLTEDAMRLATGKFADGPYRFPAFWEQGFDWAPDCNRGGSAMTGLQEMLLQEAPDGTLLPFPAWPKDVNATFRLHATGGRIAEGEIKDGKIKLTVTKEP